MWEEPNKELHDYSVEREVWERYGNETASYNLDICVERPTEINVYIQHVAHISIRLFACIVVLYLLTLPQSCTYIFIMYIYMCVCMYMYISIYIYTCVRVICVYVCMCMYIYIYVCIENISKSYKIFGLWSSRARLITLTDRNQMTISPLGVFQWHGRQLWDTIFPGGLPQGERMFEETTTIFYFFQQTQMG